LIEEYAVSRFSEVAQDQITKRSSFAASKKSPELFKIVAFGTSKAHKINGVYYPALPGVLTEIKAIVKTKHNTTGILVGQSYLDDEFSKQQLIKTLTLKNRILHISSHFTLRSGSNKNSALLLGTGKEYALSNMFADKLDFRGVDEITLSACETGVSGPLSDGREITGLGTQLMLQGAKSVLATLWSVNDASTTEWMIRYYRYRLRGMNKSAAMRKVQLDFITGRVKAGMQSITTKEAIRLEALAEKDKQAKSLSRKKSKLNYQHPFFWAAFTLQGNWL